MRPVPRRAILAAFLGFLYGISILSVSYLGFDASVRDRIGITLSVFGLLWMLLSLSLLLLRPVYYHVYSTWGILWVVYSGVRYWEQWLLLASDAILPVASLVLLLTSQYLPLSRQLAVGP